MPCHGGGGATPPTLFAPEVCGPWMSLGELLSLYPAFFVEVPAGPPCMGTHPCTLVLYELQQQKGTEKNGGNGVPIMPWAPVTREGGTPFCAIAHY